MRSLFFIISLSFAFPCIGQVYQGEELRAVFLSKAKLNSFEGVSNHLNGLIDLEKNLIDFFLDLNTLDTGIKLRDKHMRNDYLETKKYPFAEFTGEFSNESLKLIKLKRSGNYLVNGKFKIHGVELQREIELQIDFQNNNDEVVFETIFDTKLTDHNIEIPKIVFYELSNTLKITANGILKLKK